jgi:hypothetical protein
VFFNGAIEEEDAFEMKHMTQIVTSIGLSKVHFAHDQVKLLFDIFVVERFS